MKVFILARYDYGEYKTLGVFRDLTKAESAMVSEILNDPSYEYSVDEYEVLE